MQAERNIPVWSRWLIVGTIALMAVALLLTLWLTYTGVRSASQALIRGQSAQLQAALRSEFADIEGKPTTEDLDYILEEHAEQGLRHIALSYRNGSMIRSGQTQFSPEEIRQQARKLSPGQPKVHGGRVLVLSRVRTRRPPNGASHGIDRRRNRRDNRSNRPQILIEFQPVESDRLLASSFRSLTIGSGVSGLLLILAILLLRWFSRWDRHVRQAEHKRRLQSLGQMSAVMAHEIRNPLASLKGNAQVLKLLLAKEQTPETAEKIHGKVDRVVTESLRLEHLVNDLLDFAKAGSISRQSCDPATLLRTCVAELSDESKTSSEHSKIELIVDNAPRTWNLDATRIQQVITNLLDNATQASDRVIAEVSVHSNELVFVIRDFGDGISGDPAKLFEPFYTGRTQGTGLGLAVAKRLVELHGGSIDARNVDGDGAEFRVKLPKEPKR